MPNNDETITAALKAWNDGDESALERLMPLVEAELHRLASIHMRREGARHTLQTTALVNEVYLKFTGQRQARWEGRAHFFAAAAKLMRRVLVDHARRRLRHKRGGGVVGVPLEDDISIVSAEKSAEVLALDEALDRLSRLDPLKSRIVEMRHFGGMSVEETARVLGVSEVTVMRHWNMAKVWLRKEVRGEVREAES
jgi:RNA polymerase sigma factor (TIGR02999 family)